MKQISNLLEIADRYLAVSDAKTEKAVSYRVFGDTKKLGQLRCGSDITIGRYNAAMVWFADHWPDGCRLPQMLCQYSPDRCADQSPEKDVA